MKILVIGATGTTGSAVMTALRSRGIAATPAARTPPTGGVAIDIADTAALETAAAGFDAVYLLTTLGPDEVPIGLAAIAALRRAGVSKIVYLSIMNLEAMRAIPHFEAKIPLRDAVLADGRSVVLAANFFMDNDRLLVPAITGAGVYPLPVGPVGVWSIAAADIGEAAANALTRDDWNGREVPVCGGEPLTGEALAANWGAAAGRPVVYGGDDPEAFLNAAGLPPGWVRDDLGQMFRVTQAMGCAATPADVAASAAIIGRPAMTHLVFAKAVLEEKRS